MDETSQESHKEINHESTNKTPLMVAIVIIILVLGGGLYAYNTRHAQKSETNMMKSEPTQAMQKKETSPSSASSPSAAQGQVKEFTVTGANYSFTPNTLKVKKGDKVLITFKNSGGIHDFVIDEFTVKSKRIKSGEDDTVSFTADKVGTFEFYCSVGQHRSMGMKGTLTVE